MSIAQERDLAVIARMRGVVADVRCHEGFVVVFPEINHPEIRIGESITFSLHSWKSEKLPGKNQVVVLENVQQSKKGWRAKSAQPMNTTERRKQ